MTRTRGHGQSCGRWDIFGRQLLCDDFILGAFVRLFAVSAVLSHSTVQLEHLNRFLVCCCCCCCWTLNLRLSSSSPSSSSSSPSTQTLPFTGAIPSSLSPSLFSSITTPSAYLFSLFFCLYQYLCSLLVSFIDFGAFVAVVVG